MDFSRVMASEMSPGSAHTTPAFRSEQPIDLWLWRSALELRPDLRLQPTAAGARLSRRG
jgi:hypothetical protein